MKAFFSKVKKFFTKLGSYFPTKLPKGVAEFDAWTESILTTYDLPSNDSFKFALATMILHLEATSKFELNFFLFKIAFPTSGRKSKAYFAHALCKSASNQVAAAVMHQLKDKQEAAVKAEQEAAAKANGIEGK